MAPQHPAEKNSTVPAFQPVCLVIIFLVSAAVWWTMGQAVNAIGPPPAPANMVRDLSAENATRHRLELASLLLVSVVTAAFSGRRPSSLFFSIIAAGTGTQLGRVVSDFQTATSTHGQWFGTVAYWLRFISSAPIAFLFIGVPTAAVFLILLLVRRWRAV